MNCRPTLPGVLLVASLVASCNEPLPLDGRRCPCAEGYVCCAANDICLRPGETCGGTTDGGSTETGRSESANPSNDGGPIAPDRPSREIGPVGASESWTGYVENYQFGSGSDVVKMTFATTPAGDVAGSVTFGAGTPPPPATDPEIGYPAGADWMYLRNYVAEGFAYEIITGTLTGRRLKISVDLGSLWSGWCALQVEAEGSGSCFPNVGFGAGEGGCYLTYPMGQKKVDCGKLALCTIDHVCSCDPSGCRVLEPYQPIAFDVALSGNMADGSVTGAFGDHNVHFTRDP